MHRPASHGQLPLRPSRRRRTVSSGAIVVTLLVGGLAACGDDADQPTADTAPRPTNRPGFGAAVGVENATYEYTIPEGASDALAVGEPLEIVPRTLKAAVGESIQIVNEDRRGHNIGPWYVGANETLTQRFATPGVYLGICTVHPSGEFILQVFDG